MYMIMFNFHRNDDVTSVGVINFENADDLFKFRDNLQDKYGKQLNVIYIGTANMYSNMSEAMDYAKKAFLSGGKDEY